MSDLKVEEKADFAKPANIKKKKKSGKFQNSSLAYLFQKGLGKHRSKQIKKFVDYQFISLCKDLISHSLLNAGSIDF